MLGMLMDRMLIVCMGGRGLLDSNNFKGKMKEGLIESRVNPPYDLTLRVKEFVA